MNADKDNATSTFNFLSNYTLNYGNFSNVPSLYTLSYNNTNNFKQGYLQDSDGNFIFVTPVCFNCVNWNGSLSDYQIMLPNNGTPVNYNVWVEMNYTCGTTPPTDGTKKKHAIDIPKSNNIIVKQNNLYSSKFIINNIGDYNENLTVSMKIPSDSGCSLSYETNNVYIEEGEYVEVEYELLCTIPNVQFFIDIEVENIYIDKFALIGVTVIPECYYDDECSDDEFCSSEKECKDKFKEGEYCDKNNQCISKLCRNNVCSYCQIDEDCKYNEMCIDNFCVEIEGCGTVKNHTFVPYECCSDNDCDSDKVCRFNKCIYKTLEADLILEMGDQILIENETYLFRIIDSFDNHVDNAKVKSTEDRYSDKDGLVYITIPFDGIIKIEKDGYTTKYIRLDFYRKGTFKYDIDFLDIITFRVYDIHGKPIGNVQVFLNGELLGVTSKDGILRYQLTDEDLMLISFEKEGYIIPGRMIRIGDCDCWCNYLCPLIIVTIINFIVTLILVKRRGYYLLPVLIVILYLISNEVFTYFNLLIISLFVLLIQLLHHIFEKEKEEKTISTRHKSKLH